MAIIRLPINFTQFSPYVEGTLTVKWFDPDAVSAVADFASSTAGITGNTLDTSAATFTVTFASVDTSSGSAVDLTTAFNGSTGIALTVPNDYNDNITLQIELDAEVGVSSSDKSPLNKTIRHSITGISDSTFTASPSTTVEHNETEAAAGTTKSLGTFSINDVDNSATYTVNITYDKTIGSITYNNTSFLNTSASDKDVLTTTNVTNLNSVLGDLQYKPLFIASPGTNQNALQGQTITIDISSDKDSKINNSTSTITTTIDNTLQLSNSGPAPAFTENEGSAFDATGKSLGTIGLSPTITVPGVTFTATITYDKAKGSITYPDASIVNSFTDRDEISTNNLSTLNTALSSSTYLPTSIASGEDLERIEADTLAISVASSPSLVIANPTTSVTTSVTNSETELSGASAFTYVENTATTNVLPSLAVTDTADNDGSTNEVLAVVLKPTLGTFNFNETSPQTNALAYDMSSANHTNIPSNALIVQGFKTDLNNWLTNNAINFHPLIEGTGTDTLTIDVYRAPHGTAFNSDISQSSNFSSFKKIHQGNIINITNSSTVDTLAVSSTSATLLEDATNASMPSTTITADSFGTKNIDFTATVSTSVALGSGAGEFGVLSSSGGGTWNSSTGVFSFTGTQSQIDAVMANLVYNPGTDTNADFTLTYKIQVAGETTTHQKVINVTITDVIESGAITVTSQSSIVYDSSDIKSTPYTFAFSITDPDTDNVGSSITCNCILSSSIGTITSTGGTFDGPTRTWTMTDTLSNVNAATANMNFNLNAGTTTSATITINYSDSQDATSPAATVTDAIQIRDLNYDPVFMSSSTYGTINNSDHPPANVYIYTDTNAVDVYYDYDTSSQTWNKKDRYDISNIASVSMTTDTSGSLTPFANVYANYTGSSAATDRVLDNNIVRLGTTATRDFNFNKITEPWETFQLARGETDGDKDSYYYIVRKDSVQNEFTTAYTNSIGKKAIQFNATKGTTALTNDDVASYISGIPTSFSNSDVTANDGTVHRLNSHTVSFWIKPTLPTPSAGSGVGQGLQRQYILDSGPEIAIEYNTDGTIDLRFFGSKFVEDCLTRDAWNHVCFANNVDPAGVGQTGATTTISCAINNVAKTMTLTNGSNATASTSINGMSSLGTITSIGRLHNNNAEGFSGCLSEIIMHKAYYDVTNATQRLRFLANDGSGNPTLAPATINTSTVSDFTNNNTLALYLTGGAGDLQNALDTSFDVHGKMFNVTNCPANEVLQSGGSAVTGNFIGADADCVFDTNSSSGTFQKYTSSQTGFSTPVSVEPEQMSFYRFGNPDSTGTPHHSGADRNLTYYLANKTTTGFNLILQEPRAQTSSTNISLHTPNEDGTTGYDQEMMLSGDDTTERVAVAYNRIVPGPSSTRADWKGHVKIMDTTSNNDTAHQHIQLSTDTFTTNQTNFTFTTDSFGDGPYFLPLTPMGNKHWFFNNHFALLDNRGKLVIYKKN